MTDGALRDKPDKPDKSTVKQPRKPSSKFVQVKKVNYKSK